MKAITTKKFGPADRRGACIRVLAESQRMVVPYDHALSLDQNHAVAAAAMISRFGWGEPDQWFGGTLPDGTTRVWVWNQSYDAHLANLLLEVTP